MPLDCLTAWVTVLLPHFIIPTCETIHLDWLSPVIVFFQSSFVFLSKYFPLQFLLPYFLKSPEKFPYNSWRNVGIFYKSLTNANTTELCLLSQTLICSTNVEMAEVSKCNKNHHMSQRIQECCGKYEQSNKWTVFGKVRNAPLL